tara:strand:+ start:5594 stop:6634 length:1041 start_codon:yes stop_codon:yes gene_type:complete
MAFQQVEFEFPETEGNKNKDDIIDIEPSSAKVLGSVDKTPQEDSLDEIEYEDEDKDSIDGNISIEIIDDTPKKDRNRKPSDPPEDVTAEELEDYSEKVRKRIQHISKGYHDERRAKEAALRERQELEQVAHQLIAENKKLKSNVSENESLLLSEAKQKVSSQYDFAKQKYRDAYEAGNTDGVIEAQELMTVARIKSDKLASFRLPPLQTQENNVTYNNTVAPQIDERAETWRQENPWFNQDIEMTSYALGLHTKLVKSGTDPKSDEYYEIINSRMRKLFPDNFEEQPLIEVSKPKRNSTVVAPATRSTAPRKIRLTATQVRIAYKLGLTPEQYAQQVAIDMRKQNG